MLLGHNFQAEELSETLVSSGAIFIESVESSLKSSEVCDVLFCKQRSLSINNYLIERVIDKCLAFGFR